MEKISNEKISAFKQLLKQLLNELEQKAFKAMHTDMIFRGSPAEVYRKCGKKTCKCAKGGTDRHGPYKVIQINRNGTQKQITLKPGQEKYFEMAKFYVWHNNNHKSIKDLLNKIDNLIANILELRTMEDINDEQ
ncbi:MAG: hypothetical protein HQK54_16985 [Oligoflexales bacterium]|nr:hypothetical protein [Oligoflexales bacterium]